MQNCIKKQFQNVNLGVYRKIGETKILDNIQIRKISVGFIHKYQSSLILLGSSDKFY